MTNETYSDSLNQEIKKLSKNGAATLLYSSSRDGLNKDSCGLNAFTTTQQLLWFRQISTQSLVSTIQTNGKTPLARKVQMVTQIGKTLSQASHSCFIA